MTSQTEPVTIDIEPAQSGYPNVTALWRRVAALAIDMAILVAVGNLIGLALNAWLSEIGPYSRLLGLLVLLPYFGILNSSISGGQTPGKRILRIAVRGKDNQPIDLLRSLVRAFIFVLPYFLYGLSIPQLNNPILTWMVSILIFGVGGMLAFTMLFNSDTRQGIHDMLLNTWVVDVKPADKQEFPATGKMFWTISAIWGGLVIVFFLALSLLTPSAEATQTYASMQSLNALIANNDTVLTSSVTDQSTVVTDGDAASTMIISVWIKGLHSEAELEAEAGNFGRVAFENYEGMDAFDNVQVRMISGYDLAVAGRTTFFSRSNTPAEWRSLLGIP